MRPMSEDGPGEYDRRITSGAAGAFGSYLMSAAYDVAIRDTNRIVSGEGRDAKSRALHARLESLSEDEKAAAQELARHGVVSALHGLLHGLSHDEDRIRLLFDGEDVARASDGLHGDLFIWMRDLSEFPVRLGARVAGLPHRSISSSAAARRKEERGAGARARAQQSNTDQQMSFRSRWSSSTSSRIASGSWSRCHRHSSRPARSASPSGAPARAALIA